MLRLGLPEIARGLDLGHHLAGPETGGVHIGNGLLGGPLLVVREIVDAGPIARPAVVALPVQRGRIVDLEEHLQDLPVADPRRIEQDFDRLGMAAVIAVGGVPHVAPAVADASLLDTGEPADQILHPPEAASGQYGAFGHLSSPLPDRHSRHSLQPPSGPWG